MLIPLTTGDSPPEHWEYSVVLVDLFVSGQFAAAIIWAASTIEIILRDQLRRTQGLEGNAIEQWPLGRLIKEVIAYLPEPDLGVGWKDSLLELNQARIDIVHAKQESIWIGSVRDPANEELAFAVVEFERRIAKHYYGVDD